jgi:hypothetical protein
MLSGMMVELEQPPLTEKDKASHAIPPWAFICINLGDCKAFHISHKTGIVREITIGNRVNVLDARDPGTFRFHHNCKRRKTWTNFRRRRTRLEKSQRLLHSL